MDYEPIKIKLSTGGQVVPIPIGMYPDNVPMIKWPEQSRTARWTTTPVQSILVRPTTMTDFLAAMFWVDAYVERGNLSPNLVLPFVPGARQDRMNNDGDYLFTAKSVANMINARNFPTVTVLDPHSEVVSALVDRCIVKTVYEAWNRCFIADMREYAAVVAPDAGSEKRAGIFAKALNVPLVHAWKSRDVETGAITGFGHEPIPASIKGKLLIVDDICDGGGTFFGLEKVLRQSLYETDLYVTHGIFSKGTKDLLKVFNKVYTTDSIPRRQDGIEVIDVCGSLM
jgi:ribose-phosphate pyrophosphokinase